MQGKQPVSSVPRACTLPCTMAERDCLSKCRFCDRGCDLHSWHAEHTCLRCLQRRNHPCGDPMVPKRGKEHASEDAWPSPDSRRESKHYQGSASTRHSYRSPPRSSQREVLSAEILPCAGATSSHTYYTSPATQALAPPVQVSSHEEVDRGEHRLLPDWMKGHLNIDQLMEVCHTHFRRSSKSGPKSEMMVEQPRVQEITMQILRRTCMPPTHF